MKSIDELVTSMRTQEWGITEAQGRVLFDFILREKPRSILELGCGIGTSACYMAAALEHIGGGKILSIDNNPELPALVAKSFSKTDTALQRYHELVIHPTSYNYHLMDLIRKQSHGSQCRPIFDFCFIDGSHLFEPDSCGFFLAEKLLKPGGWMLFDDLTWTIAESSEALRLGIGKSMPEALKKTPHVTYVFELCVAQHGGFDSFTTVGDWGWARKKEACGVVPSPITRLTGHRRGVVSILRRVARRLLGRK